MKILIATQQVIPHEGGLSTHVVDLIAGLRAAGHDVRLIHAGEVIRPLWWRLIRRAACLGNLDRYGAGYLDDMVRRLAARVRREATAFQPDLVHCHDAYAASAALMALGGAALPIVETVHGPALYEARQHWAGRRPRYEARILRCEKEAFAGATRFITVDTGQANILKNDYGVDAGRITVIFNSVNVEDVRRTAESRSPLQPDAPYFLVPRRLVPKTGVRFAVEALAQVPRKDVHLVIAGEGPERAALQAQAASLGLAERVHFLGSVPRAQLLPLFPRAAAVLVPSVPASGVIEATSLAVMEAMACRTVAIASAIGGLAELIEDGRTGLLVSPGDAPALARAMMSVLEDKDLRVQLLAAAARKVEQDYSTQAWLKRILAVYADALAQHRGAGRAGGT